MSRRDLDRLEDIREAVAAINSHLARGGLDDGLVFDAGRIRLLEIGEAVKALPASLLVLLRPRLLQRSREPSEGRPARFGVGG